MQMYKCMTKQIETRLSRCYRVFFTAVFFPPSGFITGHVSLETGTLFVNTVSDNVALYLRLTFCSSKRSCSECGR